MIQHVCDSISFKLIQYLTCILEDMIIKFEQYTLNNINTNITNVHVYKCYINKFVSETKRLAIRNGDNIFYTLVIK